MSIKRGNPSFCVRHWIRIWLTFCSWKTLGKKICSKQVVECDCKPPSLLPLIPMQSSRKHAQNNIATTPGEFQKLGTKRYQSGKLSFEFKTVILETLILNLRTKSDSPAVLSERFPSECGRSICVCGTQTPALRGQAWAIRCDSDSVAAAAVINTGAGHWVSAECSVPAELHPLLRMLKEREPVLFRAEHPLPCLCCFCCLSSPAQSTIWAPQSNCHTVNLLSPLLQLASATVWMGYFQKSIDIWEHISFLCAGSWVKKTLTPRWLPVLLNSVLIQPLPLQPFRTSVSSSRSLLILMSCVFAISSFVPLLWLSFPI